jgi:hypothetical protein
MKPVVIQPKRRPMPDRQQRRHLLHRVDQHFRKLKHTLWISQKDKDVTDPPKVAAARKIVDAWDEQVCARKEKPHNSLCLVEAWLTEQVTFQDRQIALALVKRIEGLTLDEIITAGATMEDRNDLPIGILPQDLAALPPSHR